MPERTSSQREADATRCPAVQRSWPAWPRKWAWLPIPIFLAVFIMLRVMDPRPIYPSPLLLTALNFAFSTLILCCIAFMIGRSFLLRGEPGLLLLGCGALVWGLATLVASIVSRVDVNITPIVSNTCAWLSALCHLAGVILSPQSKRTLRPAGRWLAGAYTLAVGCVALISAAALAGWMPPFFIQGQGGTFLRQLVLGSTIAMFVFTAALLTAESRGSGSSFSYYYALALALIAAGFFGIMIQSSVFSVQFWTGMAAQLLGGVYLFVAAVAAVRESGGRGLTLGQSPRRTRNRYGVAVMIVVAATVVRLVFLQGLGTRIAYVTFFPAVMFAALYGGLRAGLLATMLSALIADYFWIEPVGSILRARDPADWLGMAIYILSCTMVSWITETMQRAQARAMEAEAEARLAVERKQAEITLHESEEKFRKLFEVESDAILLVDVTTGRFLDANAAAAQLYGYSREEFLALGPLDLSAEPDKTRQAISSRKTFVALRRHRRKDGTVFPIEIAGSYYEIQGRKIHVAAMRDITERMRAEQGLRDSHEQIKALAARLSELEESERRLLARELHDQIGQTLTALGINLNLVRQQLPVDSALALGCRLDDALQLLKQVTARVRGIMTELRPAVLDDYGLLAALQWYGGQFAKRTGINVDVLADEPVERPPLETETAFFRIAQEALTNVAKHAHAKHVDLILEQAPACIRLIVADDGVGLDPQREPAPAGEAGWGQLIMRERAASVGGKFSLESEPGYGTRVVVEVER